MKKIIAGNWKMNLGIGDSIELASSLVSELTQSDTITVWIAPSYQALTAVNEITRNTPVEIGAQNVHWETAGAFTGEISIPMLKECGCTFALTGHSERRHVFGETGEIVEKRTRACLAADLTCVLCVGETLSERESQQTENVLEQQLSEILSGISRAEAEKLVIAYEPVWAIGTGKVASIEEITAAHRFIAELVVQHCGEVTVPILYGGSVSPDNFEAIAAVPHVSGALVGGASLSAEKFLKLVTIASNS